MNLGVGRVQNVTANNVFLKEKSFCEFIISAKGKSYASMPDYCDSYFGKKHDRKYFGQIITPINLLGLIQTDSEDIIVENTLLKYVYERQNQRLASYYMNYFLCMWQYPIPNTKAASGREMKIFKPYCILLKMLLELCKIDTKESYLTLYDFSYLFLEPEGDMPSIDEIDERYAQNLIDTRIIRKAKGLSQENGSLIYIINTLAESDLLTKESAIYPEAEDFYIGLKDRIGNEDTANFIIKAYNNEYYRFNSSDPAGNREIMSEYGKYLNNMSKFEQWRSCYVNISRIGEFRNYCAEKGFSYSDDLIRRFILSLETKPFLLLTGISGSGKTKIAELWTKYLCDKGEAEGLQIAVGSNWTDNKKLIGFNNVLLDEDESFQSTELVELMVKANQAENIDKEYIVILDEMNLSRVEMYFADFLSALESLTHEITLANGDKIVWSKNIKIIGTVNVDESTYMFSPKVLDRANVIEMNGRSPKQYIEDVIESDEKIYNSLKERAWFTNYVEILDEIYSDLNGEFAYRVIDEISSYVSINGMLYGDDMEQVIKYIDEQVSQKILPKLHGSKAQLKPKLDKLQETFKEKKCPLVNSKLEKMQEDIKKGYTSFIGD